jgi:hypothetical protein
MINERAYSGGSHFATINLISLFLNKVTVTSFDTGNFSSLVDVILLGTSFIQMKRTLVEKTVGRFCKSPIELPISDVTIQVTVTFIGR